MTFKQKRDIMKEYKEQTCGEITPKQLELVLDVLVDIRDLLRDRR